MNKIVKYIILLVGVVSLLPSCYEDLGNYDYRTDVQSVSIDTSGTEHHYRAHFGDTLKMVVNVNYDKPENLKYNWILVPYPYGQELVGNSVQYPENDTIGTSLNLEWIVDKEPGWYQYFLEIKDTVTGLQDNMKMSFNNYIVVEAEGAFLSLMCLSEYDGQTDIDVFSSELALIFSGETTSQFYSKKYGSPIPGSPSVFGYCSRGYYYAFTDQTGLRLDENAYMTMADYNEMFYSAPEAKVQSYNYNPSTELLVNQGKLHMIDNTEGNDSRFSAPIAGDYEAYPYISSRLNNAACALFDMKSMSFVKYYSKASTISRLAPASSSAFVDANNLPSVPVAIVNINYGNTCAVLKDADGKMKAFSYNFNSGDESDFSGNGQRSIIDLSECEGINEATLFYGGLTGNVLYYATSQAVYSFSLSSGQTTAYKLYELPEGDEVTCFIMLPPGGYPTAGRVLWFATWNESNKEGKIIEFEVSPTDGRPDWLWGGRFNLDQTNPATFGGFGKIKSFAIGV